MVGMITLPMNNNDKFINDKFEHIHITYMRFLGTHYRVVKGLLF
jgi:hypothetical protein